MLENSRWSVKQTAAHAVRIEYTPAQSVPNPNTPLYGYIQIWINQVLAPVAEAVIDGRLLQSMWGSSAYIGFTAGSGDGALSSNVAISAWKVTIVPPSASTSSLNTIPTNTVAGVVTSVTLQLRVSRHLLVCSLR